MTNTSTAAATDTRYVIRTSNRMFVVFDTKFNKYCENGPFPRRFATQDKAQQFIESMTR